MTLHDGHLYVPMVDTWHVLQAEWVGLERGVEWRWKRPCHHTQLLIWIKGMEKIDSIIFASVIGGVVSILVLVYIIRHEWYIKSKRTAWMIRLVLFSLFLRLFLGGLAIGFVIGLVAGAVMGILTGVTSGFIVSQPSARHNDGTQTSTSIGSLTIRWVTIGLVGAVSGLGIGLIVGGENPLERGLVGMLAGIITGGVIASQLGDVSSRTIRSDADAVQGAVIGMPVGAVIGAVVGTAVRATHIVSGSSLLGMILTWWQRLLTH